MQIKKLDVYDLKGRVNYGSFAEAARETVQSIYATHFHITKNRRFEINLRGGQTACIYPMRNGFEIALPTIDPDTAITAKLARRLLGFIIHEVTHAIVSGVENSVMSNAITAAIKTDKSWYKKEGCSIK